MKRVLRLFSLGASAALSLGLASCAVAPSPPASAAPEAAPLAAACPDGLPTGARCWRGVDSAQAPYLIVMPALWSGVLVVHAHGGPFLGAPTAERADEDAKRWAITVQLGHAWAGSVFRQGGFAVTTAAEDTERVRQIFASHVAQPRRTLLHGQSWGAMVATRAAELYPNRWEGILLTSGVVAGPTTYDFRLDLRVLYQHLCNNHPRPNEPAYPLWQGLPVGNPISNADLTQRAEECLGLRKPATQRSPEQAAKLKTIVDVIQVPEGAVLGHLSWGTFTLRDVVARSGGASPFGNEGVRYRGSANDEALNTTVLRYRADPAAAARFKADTDHQGRFAVPVLSAHGIRDSTVFAESQHTLRQRMQAAGTAERLVQAFVDSPEHSYWGDAHYPPLFEALLRWVESGEKPSPNSITQRCRALRSADPQACRFEPGHQPQPLASRIAPR